MILLKIPKNIWVTIILTILLMVGIDIVYHQFFEYFDTIKENNLHYFHMFGLFIFFLIGTGIIIISNRLLKSYERCNKLKHFYETLLNNVPIPVYFKNINGIYKYGNKAFCNQIGKKQAEILNEHARNLYIDVMDEESINNILGDDIRLLRNLQDETILRQIEKDGLIEEYIIHKFPYKDEKENIEGIVGVTYRFDTMNDIINKNRDLK